MEQSVARSALAIFVVSISTYEDQPESPCGLNATKT